MKTLKDFNDQVAFIDEKYEYLNEKYENMLKELFELEEQYEKHLMELHNTKEDEKINIEV